MIPTDRLSIVKSGSHTAVCLGRGRKWWSLVVRRSRKLVVTRLSDQQFAQAKYELVSCEVAQAARRFLDHPSGLTEEARAKIEKGLS